MSKLAICSKCRFWRTVNDFPSTEDGKHACVRFPPQVIPTEPEGRGKAIFPATCPTDWCGEFKEIENV
jgi:hypothetical protein